MQIKHPSKTLLCLFQVAIITSLFTPIRTTITGAISQINTQTCGSLEPEVENQQTIYATSRKQNRLKLNLANPCIKHAYSSTVSLLPTPTPIFLFFPFIIDSNKATATPVATTAPVQTATPVPTIAPAQTAFPASTIAPAQTATPIPTTDPAQAATSLPTINPVKTITIIPPINLTPTATHTADHFGSLLNFLDISFANPTWSENPFDLLATVTFTHNDSGAQRQTEMFYIDNDTWKARFTPEYIGLWHYSTNSSDSDLDGHSGTVFVTTSDAAGFVIADGDKWTRSGSGAAFVPQFVILGDITSYYNNQDKIESEINVFIDQHGFSGFHVRGYCNFFVFGEDRCESITAADADPDFQTFEALELVINEVYQHGGVVHLWMWGDSSRTQNPKKWGLNGKIDQRLQRYIAARLGPIPGWSAGYGYDVYEWATGDQIEIWYNYMQAHSGWDHLLGARSRKNVLMQYTDILSYASYEQHNPIYFDYIEALAYRPGKPVFSEDRFRVDQAFADKDYTFEETRRGMWHSAMVGGVANIWGNMQFDEGGSYEEGSRVYPNKSELKVYSDFMNPRFRSNFETCNSLSNGMCLKSPINTQFIFYRENASSITLDLRNMTGSRPFIAVNTKTGATVTGTFQAGQQTWNAPSQSDWAIAVGNW